jgi:capsular polysaccharide biosynthesis protein
MATSYFPSSNFARKLDRLIHDAHGALCAKFGPPLEIVPDTPAVLERISIRPPSHTVWENPLEEAYYGPGEGRAIAKHPAVSLYHLKDVSITGSEAFVFGGPHTLLQLDPSLNDHPLHKVRRPISWLARRLDDGPVLSLGSRRTENHAHFVFEHLPLVLLARERLGTSLPLKILVDPGQASWQTEYLTRFGENAENVVERSRGTMFCPEVWLVPNLILTERTDLYEPEIYREIARRLKRGMHPRRKDRSVFLTRKDAPRRRLLNEDEVFVALRRVYPELERVSLTGMSLQNQIELFAEARLVVGTIGQAFTNLLFCEGALCIQLVPGPRTLDNSYCVWAYNYERLGFIHANRCLSLYADEPYHEGDWSFPLSALTNALERLEVLETTKAQ